MQRVRIGGLGATTGLFIAKPGKDISSTVLDDFLFHVAAGDKLPRPLFSGVVTYGRQTIAHNLGFVPLCFLSTSDQDLLPIQNARVSTASLTFDVGGASTPASPPPTLIAFYSIWNAKLA